MISSGNGRRGIFESALPLKVAQELFFLSLFFLPKARDQFYASGRLSIETHYETEPYRDMP